MVFRGRRVDAELLQRPQEMGRRRFLRAGLAGGLGAVGGTLGFSRLARAPLTISDSASPDINMDILPVYNIRSAKFGAKVDGVTDDSSAWQNAALAAKASGGGSLYQPQGVSIVQNPTTLYGPVSVIGPGPMGAGAVIRAGVNFPTNRGMFEVDPTANDGITFANMEVDGNRDNIRAGVGSGQTVDFVRINQEMNSQMDRFLMQTCWVHDFTGHALNFDQRAFTTQRKITDMILLGNWFHMNKNPNTVANNSGASEQECLLFTGTDTPHIIGNWFQKGGRANIHMIADAVDRLTGGMILGNNFRAAGIQNFDGSGGTTEGYNLWLEASAGNAVKDLVVENNKFVVSRRESISLNASGSGKIWKMDFIGNVYRNNNNANDNNGTDADGSGIRFRGGGTFQDLRVIAGFCDTDGLNNQKYGVALDAGTYLRVLLEELDFAASAIAPVLDNAGAAQDVIFRSCPGFNPQGIATIGAPVGGTPVDYTNQDHVDEMVYITGGTVTNLQRPGGGAGTVLQLGSERGIFLAAGQSLRIVHTAAPNAYKDRL